MEQKSIKPSNTKRFRCSMSWNKDGTKVEHLYNFHIRLHTSISVFFIIPRKVAIFCWYFVRREEFSCDSRFFLTQPSGILVDNSFSKVDCLSGVCPLSLHHSLYNHHKNLVGSTVEVKRSNQSSIKASIVLLSRLKACILSCVAFGSLNLSKSKLIAFQRTYSSTSLRLM